MTALIQSSNMEAAIAARNAAICKLTQAHELIAEANELTKKAGLAFTNTSCTFQLTREHFNSYPGNLVMDKITREFDRRMWINTLSASGLVNIMSQKEYDRAVKSLDSNVPAFTVENVKASYEDFASRIDEIEDAAILDLFKDLSWNYKSNLPVKFGKRIVLSRMTSDRRYFDFSNRHKLDDLEKALHRLDGQTPPAHPHQASSILANRISKGESEYTDNYLRIKSFKNGNMHVFILNEKLRDRLNKVLSSHYPNALPPSR